LKTVLVYTENIIELTLKYLKASGTRRCEGIVLWLGNREGGSINVKEVYEPDHQARADYFHIPEASMLKLKEHLRKNRLFIVSQVHSHPHEAFHSEADNRWAIVRHAGALSIVIPYFASQASSDNFFDNAATFQLSPVNRWEELTKQQVGDLCKISS
jgi:proteasome lid subunit RPN8/RPN11